MNNITGIKYSTISYNLTQKEGDILGSLYKRLQKNIILFWAEIWAVKIGYALYSREQTDYYQSTIDSNVFVMACKKLNDRGSDTDKAKSNSIKTNYNKFVPKLLTKRPPYAIIEVSKQGLP